MKLKIKDEKPGEELYLIFSRVSSIDFSKMKFTREHISRTFDITDMLYQFLQVTIMDLTDASWYS